MIRVLMYMGGGGLITDIFGVWISPSLVVALVTRPLEGSDLTIASRIASSERKRSLQ